MSSSAKALFTFGYKQTIKGAIIVGLLVGGMVAIQGVAYAATYPDASSQAQFAASLESAPALGILYGETKNLASPEGYMAYRTIPFMGLIVAIWALMATVKLLRGQEEVGRWEIITAGATTARRATGWLLLGLGSSFLIALSLATIITASSDLSPELTLSTPTAFLIILAIFLPGVLSATLGIFASQLSTAKRRTLLYGFVVIIICFILRAIGNTMQDFYWLKNLTIFGWSDQLDPVLGPELVWLLPFLIFTPLILVAGVYFAGKRDLGAGLIPESDTAKSRFILLGSVYQFSVRQHSLAFISWGLIALGVTALMAAIVSVAAEAVAESPALAHSINQLGGSVNDLKVSFLGTGMILTAIVLLIMVTVNMTVIRSSEAKSQLDILLVAPVRRSVWLVGHFLLIIIAVIKIAILCALATWALAHIQSISLDLGNLLLVSLTLTGIIVFTLGIGTLLYGIWPKVAAATMYAIIIWSFVIDIIGSMIELPDILAKSSLFHYLSLSPTATPDWVAFAWLTSLGVVLAVIGVVCFTKRDMIAE